MRGPRPASCKFPEEFLQEARDTVRRRTASVQSVQRFQLALLLHDEPFVATEVAAQRVGLSGRQVQRWRQRWAAGDFSIADRAGRGRKPAFSPAG
jgi:Winged helix-turn helix